MHATEELKAEHRVIELVLDALDDMAQQIAAGKPLDREEAARTLDFLRVFADKCHHGKEEQHLFARLAERGYPREAGPLGVMLHEHGQGRRHVQAMLHALEQDLPEAHTFSEHARDYVTLLRAHIQREDHVLFPMIEHLFTPEEDAQLQEAFAEIERHEIGEGAHERYHAWAHELNEAHRKVA